MLKREYCGHQIIHAIKESESGVPVKEACLDLEISGATFYRWRSEYRGIEASIPKRLKELEEEKRRLKQMYADLSLDHAILKDTVKKSCNPGASQGTCTVCD